jgi:hypothetical protein
MMALSTGSAARWIRGVGAPGARLSSVATAAAIVGIVAAAIHQLWLVGDFRVDDAYITFSFSKNLASGHGPVYSHGLRVEGYSNFLWMVLTALGLAVWRSGDPYVVARCWGMVALFVTGITVYRALRCSASHWTALLAIAFLTCCSDLFRAAVCGLETVGFAAALTLGWQVYLSEQRSRRQWMSLAFVPVALMRIDGFVPVIAAVLFAFVVAVYERRCTFRRFLLWCTPFLVLWGGYFLWRWHYYGLPLPTTYYAKSLATSHNPLRGYYLLSWFFDDYALATLIPLMIAALIWGPRIKTIALMLAVAWQAAYAAYVGGDWMPFHRFLVPVMPLVAIVGAWGVECIWVRVGHWRVAFRWCARISAAAMLAWVALRMHAVSIDSPGERLKLQGAAQIAAHTRNNLLESVPLLRQVLRSPGERLSTDYAGVFAYYTDAEIVDMWGLCNEDIALHGTAEGINPEYGKACPACFARLLPDYFHVVVPIVRESNSFSNISQVVNQIFQGRAIDQVIGLRKNYAVGRVIETSTSRTLWFLERRRAGRPLLRREAVPGIVVDYPFQ